MSHAEVARRTEVALRRNEERKAEKEERKLRMAQARLAKENTPKTQNTPTAKRMKQAKKKETPKQSRTQTPSRTPRGTKRTSSTQKTIAKDQPETPKNQSRSARAKRVRGNPVSPIESNRNESSVGSSGVEKALDYSAQVFAAVEEEIKAQIKTSPQRFQKMKSVLTPKLNQNPRNSYENQLFDNLTIESREDPNLWNSLGTDQNGSIEQTTILTTHPSLLFHRLLIHKKYHMVPQPQNQFENCHVSHVLSQVKVMREPSLLIRNYQICLNHTF